MVEIFTSLGFFLIGIAAFLAAGMLNRRDKRYIESKKSDICDIHEWTIYIDRENDYSFFYCRVCKRMPNGDRIESI